MAALRVLLFTVPGVSWSIQKLTCNRFPVRLLNKTAGCFILFLLAVRWAALPFWVVTRHFGRSASARRALCPVIPGRHVSGLISGSGRLRGSLARVNDVGSSKDSGRAARPAEEQGNGHPGGAAAASKGLIPAVIYGHKQAVVPITLTRDDVWRMIKTPGHLAELDVGGTTETVLIRDVQWDHLGKEILHLDFARVSAEEMIETEVALELRGVAAGHRGRRHPRAPGPQPAGSRAAPAPFPTRSRWTSATSRSTRAFTCAT